MYFKTYNQQGEEAGKVLLPKDIFGEALNSDLVHQVVVSQMANQRKVIAHTKDRSEVKGGGKKPWRQKGTGRARHGSIRSPIWKGGGVTFGPTKDRVFKKKINKKMRRKALVMVLSAKVSNNLMVVLEELKLEESKTKLMAQVIKNLKEKVIGPGKVLLVLPVLDKKLFLAGRNLANVGLIEARNLNTLDLLSFKYLIMPKQAIKTIKETFSYGNS